MQVDKRTTYTIRHRGTHTELAKTPTEPAARDKIAQQRRLPIDSKVSRMWHEPLSVTRTETVTVTTSGVAFEPGASTTLFPPFQVGV